MSALPTKGRWPRRLAMGCGGLLVLLIVAGAWLWIAKPWVVPVEEVAPGPGGERVSIAGNPANFYPGRAGDPSPAILLLGGSEGGLGRANDGIARRLNREGYAVLVLSWFRLPGQPAKLERVPLETFYAGLDWLGSRADIDPARVAIYGTSKGAEAALLVASRRPAQVRTVVAAAPSNVAWNGFDWNMTRVTDSSWSESGRSVPFLPITNVGWDGDIYGPALARLDRHPEAIIPVERIAGPVLLVCGEADSLWPSCPMARAVEARRRAAERQTLLLAYPDAGHAASGPPVAPNSPSYGDLDFLGGTPAGNAAARADGWPRTLAFLAEALSPRNEENDR